MSEPQLGQKRAPACIAWPQWGQLVVWVVTDGVNISISKQLRSGVRIGAGVRWVTTAASPVMTFGANWVARLTGDLHATTHPPPTHEDGSPARFNERESDLSRGDARTRDRPGLDRPDPPQQPGPAPLRRLALAHATFPLADLLRGLVRVPGRLRRTTQVLRRATRRRVLRFLSRVPRAWALGQNVLADRRPSSNGAATGCE